MPRHSSSKAGILHQDIKGKSAYEIESIFEVNKHTGKQTNLFHQVTSWSTSSFSSGLSSSSRMELWKHSESVTWSVQENTCMEVSEK